MHMLKMTSERNSSLGVSPCGLKWENKTYKLKRSIVRIFVPWAFIRVPVPVLGPLSSKVCPEVRHLFFYIYILACENICFSSLFAAGDVSRGGTSVTQ